MQVLLKPMFVAAPLEPGYRTRIVEAMLSLLEGVGYVELSVTDVVRAAKVSKRTFYELFADKEAAFLECYRAVSAELLARVAIAAQQGEAAEARLMAALSAYFQTLEEQRTFIRAFLSEVHAAGPAALRLRRQIMGRFAEFLRSMVMVARETRPELRVPSPAIAMALMGGIHELILYTLEQEHVGSLEPVGQAAYEMIRAVLLVTPETDAQ